MNNNHSRPPRALPYITYYATSTARNGDGHHANHGKPTGQPAQFVLQPGGNLPPRAFEVHPKERARFHQMVLALPLIWQSLYEIARIGGVIFDAIFGALRAKFESEIEQAEMVIQRHQQERSRLYCGLGQVPPPAVTGRPISGFPRWFSLKWWGVIVLFLLFGVSSAAALWNIGTLYLPTAQSQTIALLIATPWVLAAIGAKILTRGAKARAVTAGIAIVGLAGLVLWLIGMLALAVPIQLGDGGLGTLTVDRRLSFVGQLLCEFASGFLFLSALFEIIEHRTPEPVAQEVDDIHHRLADVDCQIQFAMDQRSKAKGNLDEWDASRSAFIEEGTTIFHLRHRDAALITELQRQRDASENLLDEFVVKPVKPAPLSAPGKAAALLLAACLLGFSGQAAPVEPVREIVIGLSPFQTGKQREFRQTLLQSFLLTGCPNGSHVVAVDGWNLTTVFDVQLPAFKFDSPSARAPKVLQALSALGRWSQEHASNSPLSDLKETDAIKVPQFFQHVSVSPTTGRRAIILLASPICLVPEEPGFSMSKKRYPSDGHLARSTVESIYGTVGHESQLTNATVFWAFQSETLWTSARHRDCVARWWSLYVAAQGGMLAGFGADAPQLLRATTNPFPRPIETFAKDVADSQLVMHTATNRIPRDEHPREVVPSPKPATASSTNAAPRPVVAVPVVSTTQQNPPALVPPIPPLKNVSSEPLPQPLKSPVPVVVPIQVPENIPAPADGDIGIAIFWQGNADIDLRVAPKAGSPEAYWNRPIVQGVHHLRDVRASAKSTRDDKQWQTAWEYCEVARARLEQPIVWLNVYDASGPIHGIVRVQFRGRVADRPFQFNVTRGDHTSPSPDMRARSACWQQVNLVDFFPSFSDSTARR